MKIIHGNLWDQHFADAICITTNGFVKRDGSAVMGRGCAYEAVLRHPGIEKDLGRAIRELGNVPAVLRLITREAGTQCLVSFPVKPSGAIANGRNVVRSQSFRLGDSVPGWACKADLDLIQESARRLVHMAGKRGWRSVVVPRPGCGAGELEWERVRGVLEDTWDDRFLVISNEAE